MFKFDILNRWSNNVQFTAELDKDGGTRSVNIGLAVKWASKSGADLWGADLWGANLRGADLRDANLPYFQIPQEGSLIVFKRLQQDILLKLRIPEDAKRTASLVGRKCRAEYVEVIDILWPKDWTDKDKQNTSLRSWYREDFYYEKGTIIKPDRYDDDIRTECTNGIHFFLTKEEAENF